MIKKTFRLLRSGDRLNPGLSNSRYAVLSQLRVAVEELLQHPDLNLKTVLDYGCGKAPYRPLFADRCGTYLMADLPGNPAADVFVDAAGALPLEEGCVNLVLSSQVLEHVSNPHQYLSEAHRVVARNGHLLLSTHGVWPYHPDPTDYWRWTSDGLNQQLQQAGFRIITMHRVLGPKGIAVQLWQDATQSYVPRVLRRFYFASLQTLICLLGERHPGQSGDACVFVMLAQRVEGQSRPNSELPRHS